MRLSETYKETRKKIFSTDKDADYKNIEQDRLLQKAIRPFLWVATILEGKHTLKEP